MQWVDSSFSIRWVLVCAAVAVACGSESKSNFNSTKSQDGVDASAGSSGARGSRTSPPTSSGGSRSTDGGKTPGSGGTNSSDASGRGTTGGRAGDATTGTGGAATSGGAAGVPSSASGGAATAKGGMSGAGDDSDGGGTPGSPGCRTNADCAGVPGKPLCDAKNDECIGCHTNAQCSATQECVGNACKPLATCKSSLDCTSSTDGKTICDKTNGVCVQCTAAADCGAGKVCTNRVCRTSCSSDNDCKALRLLCNKGLALSGQCTECTNTECPSGKYCEAGTCVPLTCNPAQQSCSQNVVVQCNETGSDVVPLKQCTLMPLNPVCMLNGDNADCVGTCYDQQRDALETDVDCGGRVCTRCGKGKACVAATDCASSKCTSNRCE